MGSQTTPELFFRHLRQPAQFQGQLLALLEQDLFVHVFLGQNVLRVSLFVQIWALMVQTVGSLQEKATVLGAAVRCVQQSAIEYKLVYGKNGQRSLPLTSVIYVG